MTSMTRDIPSGKTQPGSIQGADGISAELQAAAGDLTAAIVRLLRALEGERAPAQAVAVQAAASVDDGRLAYRVDEAAKLLGISAARLGEQIRAGRLPAIRVGRRALVSRVELERWLARDAIGQGDVYGPIPETALHDRRRKKR